MWNPSVGIKCEGSLVGYGALGTESTCGAPFWVSSLRLQRGGVHSGVLVWGFNGALQCETPVLAWGSNAELRTTGIHCGAPVWGYLVEPNVYLE